MGYYIASARIPSEQNIFLLFNEFNEFKEDLYNSFMEHVGKGVSVDLYFHNYNRRVFDALVTDANGKYTTYIIMPGKFTGIGPLLDRIADWRAERANARRPVAFTVALIALSAKMAKAGAAGKPGAGK